MAETIHQVNGIEICADDTGPRDGTPVLLVMGLGGQLVSWAPGFVDGLVGRGCRVVRFDNRDTGRSTHFHDVRIDLMDAMARIAAGEPVEVPYTLSEMAADAAGLLDVLGIGSAHLVGVSMGGMIVQTMAIEQPQAVRSVTSIMSTTGDADVGQPTDEAMVALLGPPPTTEDEAVQAALAAERIWGSPGYLEPAATEARARREWNRVRDPAGVVRQLAAIAMSPSRTEALGRVDVPFTVIHGTEDNLVTPSGGRRTAEAVPHAKLIEIDGMGHNLPQGLWSEIHDHIEATVDAAS
jgi:pimeloyl-ACP methyl ester carboxylesterase